MKKNVLVLMDFSANAEVALHFAVSFFSEMSVVFHLLYVEAKPAKLWQEFLSPSPNADHSNDQKERFDLLLQRLNPGKEGHQHEFLSLVRKGSLAEIVREEVEKKAIDYIFMGRHGVTAKTFVGRNTVTIATKVKCPTVVIPPAFTYKPIRDIGFPTDFNNWDRAQVARLLKEILSFKNARLHVLLANFKGRELSAFQKDNLSFSQTFLSPENCTFHSVDSQDLTHALNQSIKENSIDLIVLLAKNLGYLQKFLLKPAEVNFSLPFLILHK